MHRCARIVGVGKVCGVLGLTFTFFDNGSNSKRMGGIFSKLLKRKSFIFSLLLLFDPSLVLFYIWTTKTAEVPIAMNV